MKNFMNDYEFSLISINDLPFLFVILYKSYHFRISHFLFTIQ